MINRYSKEELERLYNEYGSIKEISKFLKVKYNTLYYYFKEYKIGNYTNRGPAMSKDELVKLHEKHGSITKVAAHISKSYATIRAWYSYYGIIINESNMTIFHELRNTPMTQVHKSIIIGSLLGDGHLRLPSHAKNALLEISHCEKQLGYLKWIHGLLQPFSRPIKQTETMGKKMLGDMEINNSNFYRFWTITHPDITEIFKKYYRKGLKGVNETIIDRVDLLAMTTWFVDDGSIRRRNGQPDMCTIATNSFTYKEHLVLVEIVRKFFKGTIKIYQVSSYYKGEKRLYYMLYMLGKKYVNEFLNMIKLVSPECMHYKLS